VYLRRPRLIVALAIAMATLSTPVSARGPDSIVIEWNGHAANALINPTTAVVPGAGQGPTVAVLHLAMVQGAVYDAVNAIDRGFDPYLNGVGKAPKWASKLAATATAAHHVLVGLVPALPAATLAWVETEYSASMAEISAAQPAKKVAAGVKVGAKAASKMLAARANDGRYVPFTFSQGTGKGEWRPTSDPPVSDPFAWVAKVDPFVMRSNSQFRTAGPLPLTSAAYAREYNEVKAVGALTGSTRTLDQTALALFYTVNPVEMFNRTFRDVAADARLNTADAARLFAMINLAGADGLISCWDDKEFYSFWRPITAIQLGDTDGNPDTVADPKWASMAPAPPYPDHPSGYNCLTGSMMHTAKHFFGSDRMNFTVVQTTAVGAPERTYGRFTDVIKDTIEARLYLGIHFRTPDEQGAVIGKKVARWLDRHYFHPAH
jgi:hypothetical protein